MSVCRTTAAGQYPIWRTSLVFAHAQPHCKDPLVFTLGSERKQPCRSARQPPSATRFDLLNLHPHVSLPPFIDSTLAHRLLLNPRCKIPMDESHSFPPPQPPAFPLSSSLTHSPSVPRATTINT